MKRVVILWGLCLQALAGSVVFVSVPPYAPLVTTLSEGRVQVEVLVEAGKDPHTFDLRPRRLAALAKADLYLRVGSLPFEERLRPRLSAMAPALNVVDLEPEAMHDAHGHDHDHAEDDPHVWLSPSRLQAHVDIMIAALSALKPHHRDDYAASGKALKKQLSDLDGKLRHRLQPHQDRPCLSFHGAYGHFAEAYGLEQWTVQRGGRMPSPRQLVALINKARAAGIRQVYVQPQFDRRSAEAVARALEGKVVLLDPLAPDVFANLENMAACLLAGWRV